MTEDTTLLNSNDGLAPTSSRDDFLNFVATQHHKKTSDLQHLVDKDNWGLIQRVFGPRDLIKLAKNQKILQVKNGFDLMNKCEEIMSDVVIGSLKNRAQAILTIDAIKQGKEVVGVVINELETLITDLDVSRQRFIKFTVEKEKDLKNFKDSPLTHKNYKESVEQEIETYYKSRKLQLGSIEKKIQNIERKYV